MIQKKKEQFENLVKLCDIDEATKYIEKKYENYLDIKNFLINPTEKISEIDELFVDVINPDIKIINFEFPYITLPPEEIVSKENGRSLFDLVNKVNNNFIKIQTLDTRFRDSIFNLCLSIKDLNIKSENYDRMLKVTKFFKNIALWVVDFNELYANKEQIKLVYDLLCKLKEVSEFVVMKYIGLFTNQLIKKIGSDFFSIIRLNGYPGQNINLLTPITKTRRLVDPENGNYLSKINIGERVGKAFYCDCEICTKNKIKNYETAYEVYLREDVENSRLYQNYIGKAKKTKHTKIRKIQDQFLLKHCFINTDKNLHLEKKEFRDKFKDKAKNFSLWNELYSIDGDN